MEELFAIISLFVVLPSIILTFAYRMRKLKAEERIATAEARQLTAGSGQELRLSELQDLIDDAVEDATAPLLARLEVLEAQRADAPRDPLTGDLIDDGYLAPTASPKTVGRTRA